MRSSHNSCKVAQITFTWEASIIYFQEHCKSFRTSWILFKLFVWNLHFARSPSRASFAEELTNVFGTAKESRILDEVSPVILNAPAEAMTSVLRVLDENHFAVRTLWPERFRGAVFAQRAYIKDNARTLQVAVSDTGGDSRSLIRPVDAAFFRWACRYL